jgi:hypothetical protein
MRAWPKLNVDFPNPATPPLSFPRLRASPAIFDPPAKPVRKSMAMRRSNAGMEPRFREGDE